MGLGGEEGKRKKSAKGGNGEKQLEVRGEGIGEAVGEAEHYKFI